MGTGGWWSARTTADEVIRRSGGRNHVNSLRVFRMRRRRCGQLEWLAAMPHDLGYARLLDYGATAWIGHVWRVSSATASRDVRWLVCTIFHNADLDQRLPCACGDRRSDRPREPTKPWRPRRPALVACPCQR